MIKVLLVDDQPLLRMGFRLVLEAQQDMEVIGEAGDGGEAFEEVARLRPDVVLMDVRMPGTDGIEATERIAELPDSPRILILTTFDLDEYAFAALRVGAAGFLLKNAQPAELIAGIRTVAAGTAWSRLGSLVGSSRPSPARHPVRCGRASPTGGLAG